MNLVIKGAYYFDGEEILIPHFTGCFRMVDCTRYITIEEIKETYDKEFIEENKHDYIYYGNVKYYYAEYSCFNVGDWELLSDLSYLEHIESDLDF